MKNIPLFMLLAALSFFSTKNVALSKSIDDNSINIILQAAENMCGTFSKKGELSQQRMSGEATASLNGLLRQLTDLGFEGAADFDTLTYVNVKQEELAGELINIRDCKLEIWRDLIERISLNENDQRGLKSSLDIQDIQRDLEKGDDLYRFGSVDTGEFLISEFMDTFEKKSQKWYFSIQRRCNFSLSSSDENDIRFYWKLNRSTGSTIIRNTKYNEQKVLGRGDYEITFEIGDGLAGFYSALVSIRCK